MCQGEKYQRLRWTDKQGSDDKGNACLLNGLCKIYFGDHRVPRRLRNRSDRHVNERNKERVTDD